MQLYNDTTFCTKCTTIINGGSAHATRVSDERDCNRYQGRLCRVYVTSHPEERFSKDIVGPIEETERGNQYLLCITDHFSKFAKAIPLKRHTSAIAAEELTTRWFDEYGEPMQIHTDQGAELGIVVSLDALLLIGAYVFQRRDDPRKISKITVSDRLCII